MKLPLLESKEQRYLYINPRTNIVHLLLPIMSGTDIGLDNTCKSVYALQEYFGLAGANEKKTALSALKAYIDALESDIAYLPKNAPLRNEKASRLGQINWYYNIVKKIQNHAQITGPLQRPPTRRPSKV